MWMVQYEDIVKEIYFKGRRYSIMKAKNLWNQTTGEMLTTLKQIATSVAARKKDYVVAKRIYEEAKMNTR